jgi:circadian clock protein KaiC
MTHNLLETGVPGLDDLLGGGLPEGAFTYLTGAPGSGKTTLAHQIMFALATPERPALYFTMVSEPPLKMLHYQEQFSFYDPEKVKTCMRFVNLADALATSNCDQILRRIMEEVESYSPDLVFIDAFRSGMLEAPGQAQGRIGAQQFIQQLAMNLSGWKATTFLLGEAPAADPGNPAFLVADGLLCLFQNVVRNSMVRQMEIVKLRGQATSPGLHTFRISGTGIEVFPAAVVQVDTAATPACPAPLRSQSRVAMGVPGLDEMLGGGLPAGYSLLVAGPSGSGKTVLATAFLAEGVRRGEPGVIAAFEQTPSQSWTSTIDDMVRAGQIGLINARSLDLSIDEIVQQLITTIRDLKATRVVIDSLSGFELAVAPTFREDFRESLFRMVSVLAGLGVTVLMTSELEDRYTDLRFSPYGTAFLTDAIIVQRYVEIKSRLKRVMAVVKVRGSAHSDGLRAYEITGEGIVMGAPIEGYEGILGGRPAHPQADQRQG